MIYDPAHVQEAHGLIHQKALVSLAETVKLPESVVLRLINLIIYSNMDGVASNPKVHHAYRMEVKKRLYVRCMKVYHELFRGKKEILQEREAGGKGAMIKGGEINPYIWNSSI